MSEFLEKLSSIINDSEGNKESRLDELFEENGYKKEEKNHPTEEGYYWVHADSLDGWQWTMVYLEQLDPKASDEWVAIEANGQSSEIPFCHIKKWGERIKNPQELIDEEDISVIAANLKVNEEDWQSDNVKMNQRLKEEMEQRERQKKLMENNPFTPYYDSKENDCQSE